MELASLAQLDRSHRRHDDVMATLLEAARRLAAGRPEGDDIARVHAAVAYFERAVTRHFRDEEGSVFPRLSTRRPDLAPELAALSAEHPTQVELQGRVAAAARELGEARPAAGKALLDAATALAEAHVSHVGREDAIFRSAHELLTSEDDAEIVAEMETRRDREFDDTGRIWAGGGGGGGRGRGMGGGGGGGGGRGRGMGGGGGGGRGRGRGMDGGEQAESSAASGRAATVLESPGARSRRASRVTQRIRTPIERVAKAATKNKSARPAKGVKRATATKRAPATKRGAAVKRPVAAKAKRAKTTRGAAKRSGKRK